MRIAGTWHPCDDGVTRPVLFASVPGPALDEIGEMFLIDTGADCTVFSATLLNELGRSSAITPAIISLAGIGGTQEFVQIPATIMLQSTSGGMANIQGNFAAFTELGATDYSILGRDVLNNFELLLSWRQEEIALLAPPARYEIHTN